MISSLQAHNTLLKNEVIRGKKRTSELAVQIANCRDQKTLEGSEALELVKELAVSEDKEKEEQHKKKIDELSATIKDLQKQLKTSHENQKELKLLLDVFKGSVKESRSKVWFNNDKVSTKTVKRGGSIILKRKMSLKSHTSANLSYFRQSFLWS